MNDFRKLTKKVWIDLDNSPHVPLFLPVMRRLADMGCSISVTARDCFQVCGLADFNNIKYKKVGKHYGKNKSLKILGTLIRATQLIPIAANVKPIIALSHGSRAMMIAAGALSIPAVILDDYEYTSDVPCFRPNLIIVPEVVAPNYLVRGKTKIETYPGIKEDIYVPFFKPNDSIKNELQLDEDKIIVTIRPPATEAHYHNRESEKLFSEVLNVLGALEKIKMIILPRNEIKQTLWIRSSWPHLISNEKVMIPSGVVDGLNLIWNSDLVVSGGGTMNREAAALGVPVYSIFRGKIGAVDKYLAEKGRLTLLECVGDVKSKMRIQKRKRTPENSAKVSLALDVVVRALKGTIEYYS